MLSACGSLRWGPPSDRVYTLYRAGVFTDERVHVATFDADQSDASYNAVNCEQVRARAQEGANVNFWCEQGYYRP
jgi:hypothetical protein